MRRLVLSIAGAVMMSALPAWPDGVLHVGHPDADPPFETDAEACPDSPVLGLVGYDGKRRVCVDVVVGDLRSSKDLIAGNVDQIILLTARPGQRTLYKVPDDRSAILPLANIFRRTADPLVIRGQRDEGGQHLVWFKGLDLIDTICDPDRVLDVQECRKGLPVDSDDNHEAHFDRRYEMTSIAAVENARISRALSRQPTGIEAVTERRARSYCVSLSQVKGIVIEDLAFEDCWVIAVKAVNTADITLRGLRIHGSTFGLLAIATAGLEPASHTFRILDSHWIQSPGAYREDAGRPCESPHLDLGCALDVWDDIPWGITHHHLWRPLNGALFGAYNINGNVLIRGNTLERAYNGIRMISELPGTGRNVEIRDNTFRFVRDNAVEPEMHADGWVIRHNVFSNVHAWITSDGVEGSGMYVFGNVGFYDPEQMPGTQCSDDVAWANSPRFLGLAGDKGRYELIDIAYDPTSVHCRGHYRGTILKTGDKRKAGFPYVDAISIFHNSWRTRSPLFSSKHAAPLSHFNNAVEFTGCGLEGPWHCRQIPAPLQYCKAGNKRTRGRVAVSQFWTDDGGALVADCFSFTPGQAVPDDRARVLKEVSHTFCRDAFNRPFAGVPYADGKCSPVFRKQLFADGVGKPGALATAMDGCAVRLDGAAAVPDCDSTGAPVGALRADGTLYDIAIPGAGFLGAGFVP